MIASSMPGRSIVYSPAGSADIGPHVFPMEKYAAVHRTLMAEDGLTSWRAPAPAPRRDLERVHTAAYLDDLEAGRHTARTMRSELPLDAPIVEFFELACGGTTLAARIALEHGWAAYIGGGFHHAFADHAEGFCYLNDLAVAVRAVEADGVVDRIAIIDLDVHQGNGTAAIFADDPNVFTLSVHQEDNYPVKAESYLDIGLVSYDPDREGEPWVTDALYLARLGPALEIAIDAWRPELVLYQAGADPYRDDQLGGFRLTSAGLAVRDAAVAGACREHDIPLAVTLGGGYAAHVEDTVAIHVETVRTAHRAWRTR